MGPTLKNSLRWHSSYIRYGLVIGSIVGTLYALIEGFFNGPFYIDVRLLSRGMVIGMLIGGSIGLFEVVTYYWQRKTPMWLLLIVKSGSYVILANIWLLTINAVDLYLRGILHAFDEYLYSSFVIDLIFSIAVVSLMVTALQISKLHRRNELINFIIGKYHKPTRESIIFLFVDLKGSTTLAETMGDVKYANFLKDYFTDISEPIFESGGDVYQYAGDEIIIYWKTSNKKKNQRSIFCQELICKKIKEREAYYTNNYDVKPTFRASLHTGNVITTWVGEMKRELLFIGDVLNTCSRIQEVCKQLGKDFLISGQALDILPLSDEYYYPYEDEFVPRGKQKEIVIFSVVSRKA